MRFACCKRIDYADSRRITKTPEMEMTVNSQIASMDFLIKLPEVDESLYQ